jgi:hypothetical protein
LVLVVLAVQPQMEVMALIHRLAHYLFAAAADTVVD